MNEQAILKLLNNIGAIITNDHIVYTSGKHGSVYIDKRVLFLQYPDKAILLCKILAEMFKDEVDTIIGPMAGGAYMSAFTSMHLPVRGIVAHKDGADGFTINSDDLPLIYKRRVFITEDILNTGDSCKKVVEAVRRHGGNVVGLGVLCNRGDVTATDLGDVPKLSSLFNINLDAYDEADCPLCKAGVPINTTVGKGREYLARKSGK